MSRLTGQLQKMFRRLNERFFEDQLPEPIITVIPTPKAYAHYTTYDAWQTPEGGKREINIASGTLNRPIEQVTSSLLHEMVHEYNDIILKVQDTSRNGTYHNKKFRDACLSHGLNCEHVEKYGWTKTSLNEEALEWLVEQSDFREIEINRGSWSSGRCSGGHSSSPDAASCTAAGRKGHSIRYVCPKCGAIVRATKIVNLVCGDCQVAFQES